MPMMAMRTGGLFTRRDREANLDVVLDVDVVLDFDSQRCAAGSSPEPVNEPESEPGCFGRGRGLGLGRVYGISPTEQRHHTSTSLQHLDPRDLLPLRVHGVDRAGEARVERVDRAERLEGQLRLRDRVPDERGLVGPLLVLPVARARVPGGGHDRLVVIERHRLPVRADDAPVRERAAGRLVESDPRYVPGRSAFIGSTKMAVSPLPTFSTRSFQCFWASSDMTAQRIARAAWRPSVEWSTAGESFMPAILPAVPSIQSPHFLNPSWPW